MCQFCDTTSYIRIIKKSNVGTKELNQLHSCSYDKVVYVLYMCVFVCTYSGLLIVIKKRYCNNTLYSRMLIMTYSIHSGILQQPFHTYTVNSKSSYKMALCSGYKRASSLRLAINNNLKFNRM